MSTMNATDGPRPPLDREGAPGWVGICPLQALSPGRGVAALVGGAQVAVFRTTTPGGGEVLRAVANRDPGSGANVLSRGIIGSAGTTLYVASPLHKHRFDLDSGRCLDDDTLGVATWPVRALAGQVEVFEGGRREPFG